jgi:hypothetical protein
MIELRYPKIDAPTDGEKIEQMRRYLHQLVDQLQIVFLEIDEISEFVKKNKEGYK